MWMKKKGYGSYGSGSGSITLYILLLFTFYSHVCDLDPDSIGSMYLDQGWKKDKFYFWRAEDFPWR